MHSLERIDKWQRLHSSRHLLDMLATVTWDMFASLADIVEESLLKGDILCLLQLQCMRAG